MKMPKVDGLTDRAMIAGLKLVPKNAVSRAAGHVAALRLPGPLRRAQLRAFARAFQVDLQEAQEPLEAYGSIQEFFVRSLKEGARPVDQNQDSFVSPCDGAWGETGTIDNGTLFQVKGRPYSVASLLADAEEASRFEGGTFVTLYLSPRDYHRFHAPCGGRVVRADYVPGTLWPVNHAGIQHVHGVFAQNERICAYLAPEENNLEKCICMVAVGATMVGKVHVNFDELTTNVKNAWSVKRSYAGKEPALEKGEEWGRFEFGSTIVLLLPKGLVDLDIAPNGTAVRLGSRIGRFIDSE